MFSKADRVISPSASGLVNAPSLANLRKSPNGSNTSRFRAMAADRLRSLQKQHDRESYSHKFTMKQDALQVALQQKPASPRLISNKREFDKAIKDYIMKNISVTYGLDSNPKFVRKTRMGGHLSNTLKRAGLINSGLLGGEPSVFLDTMSRNDSVPIYDQNS